MREYFSTSSCFAFGISTTISNNNDITMCLWLYLSVVHYEGSSLLQEARELQLYHIDQPSGSVLINVNIFSH